MPVEEEERCELRKVSYKTKEVPNSVFMILNKRRFQRKSTNSAVDDYFFKMTSGLSTKCQKNFYK